MVSERAIRLSPSAQFIIVAGVVYLLGCFVVWGGLCRMSKKEPQPRPPVARMRRKEDAAE